MQNEVRRRKKRKHEEREEKEKTNRLAHAFRECVRSDTVSLWNTGLSLRNRKTRVGLRREKKRRKRSK
jgi:hypothetical protein